MNPAKKNRMTNHRDTKSTEKTNKKLCELSVSVVSETQ